MVVSLGGVTNVAAFVEKDDGFAAVAQA